ncbi:SpaA isopeptide-forming pilin-related protein [Lactococcus petauri]|uniref:SpaA isopeptide-forming pilin-related protein n=1 Tax=Lactococcus petauri TaxID=1940789 RepID=UPI001781368C|nr:SpaA isopeptide-forming pilin-related protein [Lactococcus petauri]MBD5823517.1 VWA domain-containing protein [Lactococcus petauri]
MNLKRKRMKKIMMGLATFVLVFNSFAPVFAETIDDSVPVDPVKETNFFPKITTPKIDVNPNDPFTYVDDDTGLYPTHHTQNYTTNQSSDNIQNFDFSKENSEVTPTENVLGTGALDFENGYHSYGDAYVKKIVIPTDDPNNFKIQLDVIGKALKETQPVDIALVLDKSSSMNDSISLGTSKWNQLHDAVQDFSSQLLSSNNGAIRLGLGAFGSEEDSSVFAEIGKFSTGSTFTDNSTDLMRQSIIKDQPRDGSATPTFMGVDAGYKMLNDPKYGVRSDAEKVLIVLTDGLPTFYPNTNNYNNELDTNGIKIQSLSDIDEYSLSNSWSTKYFKGNGSTTAWNTDECIPPTIDYIEGQNSRFSNVLKYSIGFGTSRDAFEVLEAMGEDGHYSAANEEDLIDALDQLKNRLSNSIQNGIVTDPMSEFVTYKGSPELSALKVKNGALTEIKQGTANFPAYASDVQVVPENNQVTLNSLNFGGTETEKDGIRLTYNIELKEEYRDGKFYPANAATYLLNHKSTEGTVDYFAVPSVKNLSKPKPLNPPIKYVSDSDEKLVDSDTLTDIHEKYLYTLEGEFLELPTYDENKALKDWQLTDSTPAGITFDDVSSIKAYAWDGSTKGEDLTNSFEYSIVNGVLTIKAKPELLKDPKMYEEIHKVRFEIGARVTDEGKVERDENGKVHIVNNTKQSGHYYDDTTFDDPSNDVVTTVDKDTENALKVSKEVDKNLTENGTVDPVDTSKSRLQPITYTINTANTSATSSMDKVRILDVLPFKQDDRQTSFNAKGTAHVLSAQLVDANGEAVKGARLYYKDPSQAETNTKLDPNTLPQSATDLAAKGWLAYDRSDASVLEKTSAILVDVDNIPANTTYALKITVEHKDNVGADLINNATVNSIVNQEQTTNNVETKIYGRELSGYVWYDDNYDGLKDDAEAPVKDIAVKLYRTSLENPNYKDQLVTENVKGEKFIDGKGNSLIKTDDKGFYNFSNLSEGHYIAEFEINGKLQTKEYQVTKFMADSSNSDAKNSKVKAEEDRITAQNPIKGSDWNDVGARLKDLDTVIKPKDGLQELPYNNLGLNRSAHLDIFKKNILGDGLAGAKFAIYRGDLKEIPADGEQSADFIGTYTTDKTGNLNVDQNLFAGYDADHNPISQTYTVFEIKAPNGYELLKTPVTFTVKEGNQTINLQIKDDAESILPFTGGKAGIGLLIALSLVVLGMLGLGGGLFYRHRKNSKEAA